MNPYREPTWFDKWKMGALMGGTVGMCIGFLFGSYAVLRYGPGPNGYIRSIGKYMFSSAASFGFFMGIGTVIRTEGKRSIAFDRPLTVRIADREAMEKRLGIRH
ncbi:mitochondrial genome maintenance protein Mgr2 [Hyaloraphidium curvatum]|nr:mitochondrial genome maintenance protein Mgr2 [Hyaloraphidium curvatum]